MTLQTATVEQLQAENAWLRSRVEALTNRALPDELHSELKVAPQGARILALLIQARGAPISGDELHRKVVARGPIEGERGRCVEVTIHKLRQALHARGFPLSTVRHSCGQGYWLDPDFLRWVDETFLPRLAA